MDAVTTASLDNQATRSFWGGGGVMAYVYPFAGPSTTSLDNHFRDAPRRAGDVRKHRR